MARTVITVARADAIFVSHLQPSTPRSRDQVRALIAEYVRRHGINQLRQMVAAEFGDHPDTAAARMCWCLSVAEDAYACACAEADVAVAA